MRKNGSFAKSSHTHRSLEKLNRNKIRARESTRMLMERHNSRKAWWAQAFKAPDTAFDWIFAQAKTWVSALMSLLVGSSKAPCGFLPTPFFAPKKSSRVQNRNVSNGNLSRVGLLRSLIHEPLENRQLMAADVFAATDAAPEHPISYVGTFETFQDANDNNQLDEGEIVSLVTEGNTVDLVFGTDAFSSIEAAVAATSSGGNIVIMPGTYAEDLDTTAAGKDLTVRIGGDTPGTVVIDGAIRMNAGDKLVARVNSDSSADQLVAKEAVAILQAALELTTSDDSQSAAVQIIDNQGDAPISGGFSNVVTSPSGRQFVQGSNFTINMTGGNGNDLIANSKTPIIVTAELLKDVTDVIELNTPLKVSGNLSFAGPDYDRLTFTFKSVTSPSIGSFGFGSADPVTNSVKWEYSVDNSYFKKLKAGSEASRVYLVTVRDETDENVRLLDAVSVTILIRGINDAPVAEDLQKSIFENETLENVALPFSDPDIGDELIIEVGQIEGTPTQGIVNVDPTTGKFSYNPNGKFDNLKAGEQAFDYFTYQVTDSNGGEGALSSEVRTVTITIDGKNSAPVANDIAFTVDEDHTGEVRQFDFSDVDSSSFTFEIDTTGTRGQVINHEDGSYTYIPAGNFDELLPESTVTDSFTYTVVDSENVATTATVLVTVNGVNDQPIAKDITLSVAEDSELLEQTLDIDYVDEGDESEHVITINDSATIGSVVYLGAGKFSYSLNGKFNHLFNESGFDTFTYTVTDPQGVESETATVSIEITPVNSAPVAQDVLLTVAEDEISAITDLLVDYVDSNDSHTFEFTGGTGSIIALENGKFQYDPSGHFNELFNSNGTDEITYTVTDSQGLTSTAKILITVTPVDSTPTAQDVEMTVAEDADATEGQLVFDFIDIGDEHVFTIDDTDTIGEVTLLADGKFTYSPNGQFNGLFSENGSDSFTYTITDAAGNSVTATVLITITPVDSAPLANDVALEVAEDAEEVTGQFDFDFVDLEGDEHEITIDTAGTIGTVTLLEDGSFSYSPSGQFNHLFGEAGTDSFTYTVTDLSGNSATATVHITVTPVDSTPIASDLELTVAEDSEPVTGEFLIDHVDIGDTHTITIDDSQTLGLVTLTEDGKFTYAPNGKFDHLFDSNGVDEFSYTVTDANGNSTTAVVSIIITAVDSSPIAMDMEVSIGEDSTGESWPASIELGEVGDSYTYEIVSVGTGQASIDENGNLTYSPNGQFESLAEGDTGTDEVVYLVKDAAGNSSAATVLVTINGANDAPVAETGEVEVLDNTIVEGAVIATDVDSGDELTYVADTTGTIGLVQFNPDGTFSYNPNGQFDDLAPGQSRTDSFSFTVTDGKGGEATSSVTVTIIGSEKAPNAQNDTYSTAVNTTLSIPGAFGLLANDSGYKGAPISITGISAAGHSVNVGQSLTLTYGSVVVQADGSFTYMPTANSAGSDEFTYTVTDGVYTSTAVAKISILGMNHPPIAIADYAITGVGQSIIVDVMYNDFDQDSDTLELNRVRGIPMPGGVSNITTGGGTFSIETDEFGYSRVLYTPSATFVGIDQFSYIVMDGRGGFDGAEVYVEVRGDAVIVDPGANNPPVARDDAFTLVNNAQLALNVFSNDSDSDTPAQQLTIESITVGDVTVPFVDGESYTFEGLGILHFASATGATNFNFQPDASATGVAQFSYTINDGSGGTDTANVSIELKAANQAPSANDDNYQGAIPGELFVIDALEGVLSNDTDADSDPLTVSLKTPPVDADGAAAGFVSLLSDGSFVFIPNAGFEGAASFTYNLSDGLSGWTVATVTIQVGDSSTETPAPTLVGDTFEIEEGAAAGTLVGTMEVLDLEGSEFNFSIEDAVEGLPFAIDSTGAITVIEGATPESLEFDLNPTYTFTVVLTYGEGETVRKSVTVNLKDSTSTETPTPVLTGDAFEIDEHSAAGTVVGQVVVTGLDSTEFNFAIEDPAEGLPFAIDSTGNITIIEGATADSLEFDLNPSYTFTVILTYGEGATVSHEVKVDLKEVVDPEVPATTAPRVTNIRVNSTKWQELFRNFVHHGDVDQAGTGYSIPQGADQSTPLPWVNINQIIVEFDQDLTGRINTVTPDQFEILGNLGKKSDGSPLGTIPGITSVEVNNSIVTLTLDRPLVGSEVSLLIYADKLSNASGLALDGEWQNGVTTGNSGDGTAGGDFVFTFNVLPGDVNGDGLVDQSKGKGDSEDELLNRLVDGLSNRPALDGISGRVIVVALVEELDAYSPFRDIDGDAVQGTGDVVQIDQLDGTKLV